MSLINFFKTKSIFYILILIFLQNKMIEIQNTQSQASSQFGLSSSISVSDAHIVDEVLGTHRGFRRGVGHKLSKSASNTRSALSDFSPPVPEDVQQYI